MPDSIYTYDIAFHIPKPRFHFHDEYNISLPTLVLATYYKGPFTKARKWHFLQHQVGGHTCEQVYLVATVLNPRPAVLESMKKLDAYWLDSDLDSSSKNLDSILAYRRQLRKFGVDCKRSFEGFREGIYPIDFSIENLEKLCTDKFQKGDEQDRCDTVFTESLIAKKSKEKFPFCLLLVHWHLFILGQNCD